MTHPDPLDTLTALGFRVIWAADLDDDVLLIEDGAHRIVLADADLSRHDVADRMLAALGH